jgi:hypothetical protein
VGPRDLYCEDRGWMEPTPNSGYQSDLLLTTFTLGVLLVHCYKCPLIVATPKGHCRDTDQAACHSHCHVWMHRMYIYCIPGTCKCIITSSASRLRMWEIKLSPRTISENITVQNVLCWSVWSRKPNNMNSQLSASLKLWLCLGHILVVLKQNYTNIASSLWLLYPYVPTESCFVYLSDLVHSVHILAPY